MSENAPISREDASERRAWTEEAIARLNENPEALDDFFKQTTALMELEDGLGRMETSRMQRALLMIRYGECRRQLASEIEKVMRGEGELTSEIRTMSEKIVDELVRFKRTTAELTEPPAAEPEINGPPIGEPTINIPGDIIEPYPGDLEEALARPEELREIPPEPARGNYIPYDPSIFESLRPVIRGSKFKTSKSKMENIPSKEKPVCDTHPEFWNCECNEHYIHARMVGNYCPKCKRFAEQQPDSFIYEVDLLYIQSQDSAKRKEYLPKSPKGMS